MKVLAYLAVVVIVVVVLVGLVSSIQANHPGNETRLVQLINIGLLGEHQLKRAPERTTVSTTPGPFFWVKQETTEPALVLTWGRGESDVIQTTLPLSLVKITIDDSKSMPTLEFVFDQGWLNEHRLAYTDSDKSNLNWWLAPDQFGVFRKTSEDLQSVRPVRIIAAKCQLSVTLHH